jgi:hypothetical protein
MVWVQIIEQNTTFRQPTTERIASARNDRDSTYWVVSHDYGTNKFRIFHATTGGFVEVSAPELGMAHDSLQQSGGLYEILIAGQYYRRATVSRIIPGPARNYVEFLVSMIQQGY